MERGCPQREVMLARVQRLKRQRAHRHGSREWLSSIINGAPTERDVMTHATLTTVAAWALVASADELLLQPGHCGVTVASRQSCAHDSQSSGARKAASLRVCLRRCTSCPRCSVASYTL